MAGCLGVFLLTIPQPFFLFLLSVLPYVCLSNSWPGFLYWFLSVTRVCRHVSAHPPVFTCTCLSVSPDRMSLSGTLLYGYSLQSDENVKFWFFYTRPAFWEPQVVIPPDPACRWVYRKGPGQTWSPRGTLPGCVVFCSGRGRGEGRSHKVQLSPRCLSRTTTSAGLPRRCLASGMTVLLHVGQRQVPQQRRTSITLIWSRPL